MTVLTSPSYEGGLSLVRRELLEMLTCPESGLPLTGWDGVSQEGLLRCEDSEATYPVRDGIPVLLPLELQEGSAALEVVSEVAEKKREMAARDAQVGAYDRMMGLKVFTSAELPLSLHYLRPESDNLMLEGGCGTGRMTPAFAAAARGLMALDFSMESLRVARGKLSPELQAKTLFIQADLSKLPLCTEVFDRVGSFGVYEHIPTPEARAKALSEMARVLKPRTAGGRFALSAYRWGPPQSWGSEREGHHDGGIYFYRFTKPELTAQVREHFEVRDFTETLLYYHLLWGRKPV